MDITPTNKQILAMQKFVDALCGEEPSRLDHSQSAVNRRAVRANAMDMLHRMVGLSIRIGAERMKAHLGMAYDQSALAYWKDPHSGAEKLNVPRPDGDDGQHHQYTPGKH